MIFTNEQLWFILLGVLCCYAAVAAISQKPTHPWIDGGLCACFLVQGLGFLIGGVLNKDRIMAVTSVTAVAIASVTIIGMVVLIFRGVRRARRR